MQELVEKNDTNKHTNEALVELIINLKHSFIRQSYYCEDKEKLFNSLTELNQHHKNILRYFREKNLPALEQELNSHWMTKYIEMI